MRLIDEIKDNVQNQTKFNENQQFNSSDDLISEGVSEILDIVMQDYCINAIHDACVEASKQGIYETTNSKRIMNGYISFFYDTGATQFFKCIVYYEKFHIFKKDEYRYTQKNVTFDTCGPCTGIKYQDITKAQSGFVVKNAVSDKAKCILLQDPKSGIYYHPLQEARKEYVKFLNKQFPEIEFFEVEGVNCRACNYKKNGYFTIAFRLEF